MKTSKQIRLTLQELETIQSLLSVEIHRIDSHLKELGTPSETDIEKHIAQRKTELADLWSTWRKINNQILNLNSWNG